MITNEANHKFKIIAIVLQFIIVGFTGFGMAHAYEYNIGTLIIEIIILALLFLGFMFGPQPILYVVVVILEIIFALVSFAMAGVFLGTLPPVGIVIAIGVVMILEGLLCAALAFICFKIFQTGG